MIGSANGASACRPFATPRTTARQGPRIAVTASGKIEPQTSVDISADITGRIIKIAVEEGDVVRKGQFLIQIDPAQYQAAVSRAERWLLRWRA